MRRTWPIGAIWLLVITVFTSCSQSTTTSVPAAVQAIVDNGRANAWTSNGDDPWEVFVCHVPADTVSPTYAGLPVRRTFQPAALATILDATVTPYFQTLSNRAYRPQFSAGGEVSIAATDEPQACVDKALAAADPTARGVIAVADAEHNADKPGGFGSPGGGCEGPCPASTSRRSAYVGAVDFSPDWGDRPPMDLIEHEIGHAIGWPHSGYDESSNVPEKSALDVMSNSAAPRDVDPQRRDAPDTLAINRLAAGWLPVSGIAVVPPSGVTVTLASSNGTSGSRVAVIGLDADRFITVELLMAAGFDAHLPASGVAVHLIDGSGPTRTQTPLVGLAPYTDLLGPGETFSSNGWRISVADGWRATIQPLGSAPTLGTT